MPNILDEIRCIEFMTVELNLYLDTHPMDQKALYDFNCYHQKLMALKHQYECMCGPLLNFGFSPNHGCPWKWIAEPWPWEKVD